MINSKCEKSSRRKKDLNDGINLSADKNNCVIADTKLDLINNKILKSKKHLERSKILNKCDKNSSIECLEDPKSKSFLKMSLKMKNCFDDIDINNLQHGEIMTTIYRTSSGRYTTNPISKIDKLSNSKICSSCKSNGSKNIKCKTGESQFYVSNKKKDTQCCRNSDKQTFRGCEDYYAEIFPAKHLQKNNCSLLLEGEKKILKVDILLKFLDQMRLTVISRQLSFDTFRMISERLYRDNMNIELLLLTEMIIRAQVLQMTNLISKDVCQNKLTPPLLVKSFLKQYQFLKSLSVIYKEMLFDYETTFLASHKLSFDLINRAYFKRIVNDCPNIKEHIDSGYLNIKVEQLCIDGTAIDHQERMKIDYHTMKSDFQDSSKWTEVNKTIKGILHRPDDIVNSLISHCFQGGRRCKKMSVDHICQCGATYQDILDILSKLPERLCSHKRKQKSSEELFMSDHQDKVYNHEPDLVKNIITTEEIFMTDFPSKMSCHKTNRVITAEEIFLTELPNKVSSSSLSPSSHKPNQVPYLLTDEDMFPVHKGTHSVSTETNVRLNCGNIYQALENIKPPSISCSSSSNNSNGYNSCVSISSYEVSSDDDDDDNNDRGERLFQKLRRKVDIEELSRSCDAEIRQIKDADIQGLSGDAAKQKRFHEERLFRKIQRKCQFEDLEHTCDTEIRQTTGSFDDDDFQEFNNEFAKHQKWLFCDKERGDSPDEIKQFDKLYEQYLAENEHLLERNAASQPSAQMSVPDYLNTLEKADNLQSIIKILMARYKKNIEIQEKISQHPSASVKETTSVKQDKIPGKEDDFETDFEDLSHTLGLSSSTRDNLEQFERFLNGKLDINMGKSHPNLQALVNNCRMHCSELYKEGRQRRAAGGGVVGGGEPEETMRGGHKRTVSGDELFDIPIDCSSAVNIEMDSNHDSCSNNNTSTNNNMSSSDTGSHSSHSSGSSSSSSSNSSNASTTENTGNQKTCNCCKCEMFGEQNYPLTNRKTSVRERLRNKLQKQKQKQCHENVESSVASVTVDMLPDVDILVDFINGSDKAADVAPPTPEVTARSLPKKNKQKANKLKVKRAMKLVPDFRATESSDQINKVNDEKKSGNMAVSENIVDQRQTQVESGDISRIMSDQMVIDGEWVKETESGHVVDDEVPEKEVYDPVVEEFKRFCSNVVVPKNRKKLLFCTSLLIGELEKRQMDGNVVNGQVAPSV